MLCVRMSSGVYILVGKKMAFSKRPSLVLLSRPVPPTLLSVPLSCFTFSFHVTISLPLGFLCLFPYQCFRHCDELHDGRDLIFLAHHYTSSTSTSLHWCLVHSRLLVLILLDAAVLRNRVWDYRMFP